MRRLLLVRHAQASFFAGVGEGEEEGAQEGASGGASGGDSASRYDRLSDHGRRQSRILGDHWARRGFVPDRVYVGPLRRHHETLQEVAGAFAEAGLVFPEAVGLPELSEHQGMQVVEHCTPLLAARDEAVAGWVGEAERGGRMEVALRIYRRVTRLWARGELPEAEAAFESWKAFRERVEGGLRRAVEDAGSAAEGAKTLVAFTSGGPVAAAVAHTLGLDDERTLELSWIVKNTACTELRLGSGGLSLLSFNGAGHLGPDDETMI